MKPVMGHDIEACRDEFGKYIDLHKLFNDYHDLGALSPEERRIAEGHLDAVVKIKLIVSRQAAAAIVATAESLVRVMRTTRQQARFR